MGEPPKSSSPSPWQAPSVQLHAIGTELVGTSVLLPAHPEISVTTYATLDEFRQYLTVAPGDGENVGVIPISASRFQAEKTTALEASHGGWLILLCTGGHFPDDLFAEAVRVVRNLREGGSYHG